MEIDKIKNTGYAEVCRINAYWGLRPHSSNIFGELSFGPDPLAPQEWKPSACLPFVRSSYGSLYIKDNHIFLVNK